MAHTCLGQIIPELRVSIVCSYPPCTTLNATNSLACLTIHMCNKPPRYIHTCHHPPMLQSWTKSVMNFALPYSQDTHVEDLAPQWTLPPPHTNQSCSVRHNNVSAGHHCFCFRDFEIRPKFSETRIFPGTILHPFILLRGLQRDKYFNVLISQKSYHYNYGKTGNSKMSTP